MGSIEVLNCYRVDDESGSYYYAARSKSDAVKLHESLNDLICDLENPSVELLPDDYELTIIMDEDGIDKQTKTVREWISQEGRGNLAVPSWLLN